MGTGRGNVGLYFETAAEDAERVIAQQVDQTRQFLRDQHGDDAAMTADVVTKVEQQFNFLAYFLGSAAVDGRSYESP